MVFNHRFFSEGYLKDIPFLRSKRKVASVEK
ncbi:hypothetical protein SAMN05216323_102638 [Williamwhitmania taraxaci]|uniref:Uncharacterized protein n=1 Tax=Williamwhitmania taraxaci TaxID=1640674 RepID=A0A1G6KRA8_9BACT|nr:hypothetical protein SAMN05216323_102638 [Williamwhitmania taraxaci]